MSDHGSIVETYCVEGVGGVSLAARHDGTWDVVQTDASGYVVISPALVGLTETEARKEWDETAQWLAWTGTRLARAAAAQREAQ